MTAEPVPAGISPPAPRASASSDLPASPSGALARLASLDAFRGLVILAMTFVNYLAGVKSIPAWAKHMPENQDGYTFVDVVFPGFLFIVGVAIPLALHKRMARGESLLSLLQRVLVRSASLLFVGVIMVNSSSFSAGATGMSKSLWFLLAMLAVVVLWNIYPADAPKSRRRLFLGLRIFAGLTLAGLVVVFRGKNSAGEVVWLQHSWWGILGLIGWAYLVCCAAYLAFRGSSVALMGVLGFLIALFIGDHHGVLDWLGPIHNFVGVGPVLGSTAAGVMMGVLVGNCFVGEAASLRPIARARFFLLFGLGLYAAGLLLRPLHGIHKNAATDSYTLVTGGLCCLSFLLVYLLMDVANVRRWAGPLVPVGQNALLAYILPGILGNLFAVIGLPGLLWHYGSSWPGALNAAAVTLLVLAITWGATRIGIRLKL
jgi:heparan-alpha-glucosaminide N-acetyltransferase